IVFEKYEDEWKDAIKRATVWITEKIKVKAEKYVEAEEELYQACEQYFIEQGIEIFNKEAITELDKIVITDNTRQAVYSHLRSGANKDNTLIICKSQNNDGSFSLHSLIKEHLQIRSIDTLTKSLKRFSESQALRRSDDSIWITAFTITYIKIVLVEHEPEWRKVVERASFWVTERIKNAKLEKELYSACEQYLIDRGCSIIQAEESEVSLSKNAYLNPEIIVIGAVYEANRKFEKSCVESKTKFDLNQARKKIDLFVEEEVENIFATRVTYCDKEDILRRAKRAARFLVDEHYKTDELCCSCCGKDY
ncbi:6614_t:CDS:1, partial [Acaulospora morrowiae]